MSWSAAMKAMEKGKIVRIYFDLHVQLGNVEEKVASRQADSRSEYTTKIISD